MFTIRAQDRSARPVGLDAGRAATKPVGASTVSRGMRLVAPMAWSMNTSATLSHTTAVQSTLDEPGAPTSTRTARRKLVPVSAAPRPSVTGSNSGSTSADCGATHSTRPMGTNGSTMGAGAPAAGFGGSSDGGEYSANIP